VALPGPKAYSSIVKHLGPHGPDGLLAFVLFVASSGLVALGWDPLQTYGFAVIIFAMYGIRQTLRERHQERSAEQAVKERELAIYEEKERQGLKIAKERAKLAKQASAQKQIGGRK